MNTFEVERYLLDNMPMTASLGFSVKSFSADKVEILAPLEKNINHCGTAFGGSISVLATLSAWCLVWANARDAGLSGEIIICDQNIKFKKAIHGDICSISESRYCDWTGFRERALRGRGAKVSVMSIVGSDGVDSAIFLGEFAIISR